MLNENKTSKIEITVKGNPKYHYGQKLFGIKPFNSKGLREPCPICDDTRKVTIRGVEFQCPACSSNSSYNDQNIENSITVCDYKIVEYIVNKVVISGPDYKSAYKGETDYYNLPFVSFEAFERTSNGYNGVSMRKMPGSSYDIDPTVERMLQETRVSDYVFTDKKLANEVIKALKARDKGLLEKFNAEHGSSHEYPFD